MFTPQTEILTAVGFRKFSQINCDSRLALFDPDGAQFIGFHNPPAVKTVDYSGEVLHLDGTLSMRITPDHWLYTSLSQTMQKRVKPQFALHRACARLYGRFDYQYIWEAPQRFCRVGKGGTVSQEDTIFEWRNEEATAIGRLIGFGAGDGYAPLGSRLIFKLKKTRKIQYLRDICEKLSRRIDLKEKDGVFTLSDHHHLGHEFRNWLYHPCGQKRLPHLIFTASPNVQHAVLDGLMNSDGYVRQDGSWEYCTGSPYLVRDIQALGALVGQAFSVTQPNEGLYRLYQLKEKSFPHVNDARRDTMRFTLHPESCKMVAVTGVYGLVTIRHNQHTVLCGL